MPPKDTIGINNLFAIGPDGLEAKLTGIEDFSVSSSDDLDEDSYGTFSTNDEYTFTTNPISLKMFWWRVLKLGSTNNWLKMHGFPMRRKGRKRKNKNDPD